MNGALPTILEIPLWGMYSGVVNKNREMI